MSEHDELEELVFYISGMRRTINRKLDDHLFIMQEQHKRIDEQMHIIDDQKQIIDELAWQIRDLRDSVRKVSEQKSSCVCRYENHEPKFKPERNCNSDTDDQQTDFYEHIEFKAISSTKLPVPAQRTKITSQTDDNQHQLEYRQDEASPSVNTTNNINHINNNNFNYNNYDNNNNNNNNIDNYINNNNSDINFKTTNKIKQNLSGVKYAEVVKTKQDFIDPNKDKRTTRYVKPINPPVAVTSTTTTTTTTVTNINQIKPIKKVMARSNLTATAQDSNQIQTQQSQEVKPTPTPTTPIKNTNQNNNNLDVTKQRKFKALSEDEAYFKFLDIPERDSIDEEVGDILFRAKEFKRFSSSNRGSSKVLCSFISDVEADYLPHEEEITEENLYEIKRTVVSDAVVDYSKRESETSTTSKRIGIYK